MTDVPCLDGPAREAVHHRGGHLQVLAAAGAGKTEVVAQRLSSLLAGGVAPEAIVALTFTVAAAKELKSRLTSRSEAVGVSRHLSERVFVGTFHSFAYRLLRRSARGEADVLTGGRLVALVARESDRIGLSNLGSQMYRAIDDFLANLDVVDNELLEPQHLRGSFNVAVQRFDQICEELSYTTYGRMIREAVSLLAQAETRSNLVGEVRHVVVDEYQDVNTAQERLLRVLVDHTVELCVVGDDDQSIYAWRGADVSNFVGFRDRYSSTPYPLLQNRRSRPQIVACANDVAETIPGRLPKTSEAVRDEIDAAVTVWHAEDEESEARHVAESIVRLRNAGHPLATIAVLARTRRRLTATRQALEDMAIPVATPGRVGLFLSPIAQAYGVTVGCFAGKPWRSAQGERSSTVSTHDLPAIWVSALNLEDSRLHVAEQALDVWQHRVNDGSISPAADFVDALTTMGGVAADDTGGGDPAISALVELLDDFVAVRHRRSQVSGASLGRDAGRGLYRSLWMFLQYWALKEADETPAEVAPAGVHLGTVHGAKGLEWTAVFLVGCTTDAFPSLWTGKARDWLIPTEAFPAQRYEGRDEDERRLFYVGVTRARDLLSISWPGGRRGAQPSPYISLLRNAPSPQIRPRLEIPPFEHPEVL